MTLADDREPREADLLVCVECSREIDVCAFCDDMCRASLCYRCVKRLLYLAGPGVSYAGRLT
jgi:hypothetical protein